jgi:hypothetical protein
MHAAKSEAEAGIQAAGREGEPHRGIAPGPAVLASWGNTPPRG